MKRRPPKDNVRNIQPQGKNLRFKTSSPTGRTVQVEFWRERKFLFNLAYGENTVADIISQPERLEYFSRDGILHTHIPDFKVIRTDGRIEIHDVIRQEYAETAAAREREQNVRPICQAQGWDYYVHIEESLASETEIANIQIFSAYKAGVHCRPQIEAAAHAALLENSKLDIEVLARSLAGPANLSVGQALAALGHMLYHGRLVTDISTRLLYLDASVRSGTFVWLPES